MMKKIVAGFLAGALMMVSVQAFGSGVNLIGKKIDGQADLKIDGKVVGQTIIVQGKSYAPVREITNGVGGSVQYNKSGGAVEMSLNDIAKLEEEQMKEKENIANLKQSIVYQKEKIADTEKTIQNYDVILADFQKKIDRNKEQGVTSSAEVSYQVFQKSKQDEVERLNEQKAELTKLESQLASLEG